jgi:lipopolysaccharide export system protein LptC
MADPRRPASNVRAGGGGRDAAPPGASVTTLYTKPSRNQARFLAVTDRRRTPSVLHSRIVSFLKVVLPGAALALAVVFFIWPYFQPSDRNFRVRPIPVTAADLENLNVVGARFVGLDGRNQPFTLMADQAIQATGASNSMDLDRPQGDITLRDGSWLAVTANRGTYQRPANTLTLNGDVSLFQDGGYEVHTEAANIDLARGHAEGSSAVRGQGPGVQMEGTGFQIFDRGQRMLITGPSRLVILPSTKLPGVAK